MDLLQGMTAITEEQEEEKEKVIKWWNVAAEKNTTIHYINYNKDTKF